MSKLIAPIAAVTILRVGSGTAQTPGKADARKAARQTEANIEQVMFVGLTAMKDSCAEKYPAKTVATQAGFDVAMKSPPPETIALAKTPESAASVRERMEAPREMTKQPANTKEFAGIRDGVVENRDKQPCDAKLRQRK
jgi:hypothetical protein